MIYYFFGQSSLRPLPVLSAYTGKQKKKIYIYIYRERELSAMLPFFFLSWFFSKKMCFVMLCIHMCVAISYKTPAVPCIYIFFLIFVSASASCNVRTYQWLAKYFCKAKQIVSWQPTGAVIYGSKKWKMKKNLKKSTGIMKGYKCACLYIHI